MLPQSLSDRLFIDHLVLVVSDIDRTRDFYSKIFGDPAYQTATSIMYSFGRTRLFIGLPHGTLTPGDAFNPNRIGLEHFAIGIESVEDLQIIEKALDKGAIKHSGIHLDSHSKREKIWLDDPDKIRIEFFT